MLPTLVAILYGYGGARYYALRSKWSLSILCLVMLLAAAAYGVKMNYYFTAFATAWSLANLWQVRPRPHLDRRLQAALSELHFVGDAIALSADETKFKPGWGVSRSAHLLERALSTGAKRVMLDDVSEEPNEKGNVILRPMTWKFQPDDRVIEINLRENGTLRLKVLESQYGLAG